MESEFEILKRKTLDHNVRNNSFQHVLRLLKDENKKVLVEIGRIRNFENNYHHEGYSTLLLSILSQTIDSKLYSVDNL